MGDIIYVEKGQRVPADLILLRTTEHSGSCFIRTDQLGMVSHKMSIKTFFGHKHFFQWPSILFKIWN